MKCPNDGADLAPAERDRLKVEACPKCQGLWLTPQELNALEDERFDLGDQNKGTLVFHPEVSTQACPECSLPMQAFEYRDYDLALEFCPAGHGFWLGAGDDQRVLALMRREELREKWSHKAEDAWGAHLRFWSARGFFEKLKALGDLRADGS
jgi:Zn-finger nucleic acid-binding protein